MKSKVRNRTLVWIVPNFSSFLIHIISSSSIYRGELSFLQAVHFCICWHDSAVLIGYLFQRWLACMHVPNWKNVLGVSAVVRCVW